MKVILLLSQLQSLWTSKYPDGAILADLVDILGFPHRNSYLSSIGDKSLKQIWNQVFFHHLNQFSPVKTIFCLQCNVKRETHCGDHISNSLKVTAFVLKDSSGVEIRPPERTLVETPGLGNNVIKTLW
jgi:hypothetical protein